MRGPISVPVMREVLYIIRVLGYEKEPLMEYFQRFFKKETLQGKFADFEGKKFGNLSVASFKIFSSY